MLTKGDLKYNFLIFKLITKLHFFPVKFIEEVEKDSGKTGVGKWQVDDSWKGRFMYKLWQFLSFCHASYIVSRSVYSIVVFDFNLEQTPAMIMWSIGYMATIPGLYSLFDKWPELNVKLFNEFHMIFGQIEEEQSASATEEEESESNSKEENEVISEGMKSSTGQKRRKTQKELLICYLPLMLLGFVWAYPILYAADRRIPFLLVSVLDIESIPDKMIQNIVVIGFLLSEMILQSCFIAFCTYCGYFVLSFSSTFMENAELELQKLKNENIPLPLRLEGAQRALHYFNLEVGLFNICFSRNIYIWKTLNLTVAIIAGFASIKLISKNVPFSFLYFILFVDTCSGYIGMFNSAFKITDKIKELKLELAVRSAQGEPQQQNQMTVVNAAHGSVKVQRCMAYRKVVESIPIKSGGFNTLERESTLFFLDYVTQEITGLLISF